MVPVFLSQPFYTEGLGKVEMLIFHTNKSPFFLSWGWENYEKFALGRFV